ncbi:MAG TPA: DUF3857 domain-containing protein [Candidatus Angelobacter sp.]|jgi:hypothetical protein
MLLRRIVLMGCCLFSLASFAQKEDWLPVAPEELQIKEVPGDPGAAAVQLYYANYIDDSDSHEFVYHRIKILNESGIKQYADIEISGGFYVDVSNLKARTIHPDGSVVEFAGKPFDKTIFKSRGIKWTSKAFTMPDVTVGSIIEYKYRLKNYSSEHWVLQHDLYTVREYLIFQPRHWGEAVAWSGRNLDGPLPSKKSDGWELSLTNVPAFQPEASMPPETVYMPAVDFYYVRQNIKNADKFWEEIGKILNEFVERYIGNRKEIREAALQAIGGETDPEKKLRKLYARAQEVRNLSFERARTQEERKKEKIKDNQNLGDIVKRGYGDSEDITAFFVGMARAAGFNAQVLFASSRRDSFFSRKIPTLANLHDWIAVVNLNGNEVYLQPGVRFCPYGLMRWANTSTDALKFDKKGGTFVAVPPLQSDRSLTHRVAKMTLADDGSLNGEITVEFQGEEALEHRLDAINADSEGKKKDLEDELKVWLPAGAAVKMLTVQGWESPGEALTAHFSVEVPGYASSVGKRLLLPSLLFEPQQKDAFAHAGRKYPVYFSYPFTERDRVVIKLPSGYSLESVPPKQDVGIGYARYLTISVSDGKNLVSERALGFNAVLVPVEKYAELKDFMIRVQAGDGQQVVLKEGNVNAQKTN